MFENFAQKSEFWSNI